MNSNDKGKVVSYSPIPKNRKDPNSTSLGLELKIILDIKDSSTAYKQDYNNIEEIKLVIFYFISIIKTKLSITLELREKVIQEILKGEKINYKRILGVSRSATENKKYKTYLKRLRYIYIDYYLESESQAKAKNICTYKSNAIEPSC